MTKERILKGGLLFLTIGAFLLSLSLPVLASELRDYDANAVIYGGAYSISELRDRVQNGSGPNPSGGVYGNWQSPNGVRTFFNGIGIREEQWGVQADGKQHLTNGTVNKNGQVIVGGIVVASGVFSAGRENMGASTLKYYGPIPIYWREPKYSFKPDSLDAFVYLNSDGTFGYAIIKSCGNPVLKSNLYADVKPIQVPQVQKFTITVKKFNDKDGDKKRDGNEGFLQGWEFTIKGNGINRPVKTTNKNGELVFGNLPAGTYTITEKMKSGWESTTGLSKKITVGPNKTVLFGNKVKPIKVTPKIAKFNLTIIKFNDKDGDKKKDSNEEALADWEFTLKGNGVEKKGKTDAQGKLVFTDLTNGSYTITETKKEGWTVTTANPLTVTIKDSDQTVLFGNKKPVPVTPMNGETPPKEVTPETVAETGGLPQAGAEEAGMAFGFTSLGSGMLYWLRSRKLLAKALKSF